MSTAEAKYAGRCGCGRTVTRRFPLTETIQSNGIRRVRCADCRAIVPCEEQEPGDLDG